MSEAIAPTHYKAMTGAQRGAWIRQHSGVVLSVEQLASLFLLSPDWIRCILNGAAAPDGDYWNTGIGEGDRR